MKIGFLKVVPIFSSTNRHIVGYWNTQQEQPSPQSIWKGDLTSISKYFGSIRAQCDLGLILPPCFHNLGKTCLVTRRLDIIKLCWNKKNVVIGFKIEIAKCFWKKCGNTKILTKMPINVAPRRIANELWASKFRLKSCIASQVPYVTVENKS